MKINIIKLCKIISGICKSLPRTLSESDESAFVSAIRVQNEEKKKKIKFRWFHGIGISFCIFRALCNRDYVIRCALSIFMFAFDHLDEHVWRIFDSEFLNEYWTPLSIWMTIENWIQHIHEWCEQWKRRKWMNSTEKPFLSMLDRGGDLTGDVRNNCFKFLFLTRQLHIHILILYMNRTILASHRVQSIWHDDQRRWLATMQIRKSSIVCCAYIVMWIRKH